MISESNHGDTSVTTEVVQGRGERLRKQAARLRILQNERGTDSESDGGVPLR